MTRSDRPVDVVVAVPPGSRRPEPLIDALARLHPQWRCRTVWAGDPQLRPRLRRGIDWLDVDVDEGDLLRVEADALPWLVALSAIERAERATVVIVCGAALLDEIDALVPDDDELVVVPRSFDAPGHLDGHPSIEVLGEEGAVSSTVAGFGAGSSATISWILDQLIVPSRLQHAVSVGRVLELAAQYFPSRRCDDDRIGASVWRWPDRAPALLDLADFDVDRPWLADPTLEGPPRITLGTPDRLDAIERAGDQLAGSTDVLRLPGGIEVGRAIHRIARHHTPLPARPWSDAAAFRRWLDDEYWEDVHWARDDLQAIFPYRTGLDAERFAAWKRRAVTSDQPVSSRRR